MKLRLHRELLPGILALSCVSGALAQAPANPHPPVQNPHGMAAPGMQNPHGTGAPGAQNPHGMAAPGIQNPHGVNPHSAGAQPGSQNPHSFALNPTGAPRSPAEFHEAPPPVDGLVDDDSPPGTLIVETLNGDNLGVPGVSVELITTYETIAEGKHETVVRGTSGPDGRVVFGGLKTGIRSSYAVLAPYQGASYRTASFRLPEKNGLRAQVHVYPAVSNIEDTFVGMRSVVYVQLRESAFHFEILYRIFNMSRVAWVPKDVSLALPERAEGFTPSTEPTQLRVDESARKAFLEGTFPPGSTDLRITFQVPSRNKESETFSLGALPHVADMRVIAEKTKTLTLQVPGFDFTGSDVGPSGADVLFARKTLGANASEIGALSIELSGLPVTGPERWYAVALALALAGAGFAGLRRKAAPESPGGSLSEEERAQAEEARAVLLEELGLLEKAKRNELVGPRTYESTRKELLDALARLALVLEKPKSGASEASG